MFTELLMIAPPHDGYARIIRPPTCFVLCMFFVKSTLLGVMHLAAWSKEFAGLRRKVLCCVSICPSIYEKEYVYVVVLHEFCVHKRFVWVECVYVVYTYADVLCSREKLFVPFCICSSAVIVLDNNTHVESDAGCCEVGICDEVVDKGERRVECCDGCMFGVWLVDLFLIILFLFYVVSSVPYSGLRVWFLLYYWYHFCLFYIFVFTVNIFIYICFKNVVKSAVKSVIKIDVEICRLCVCNTQWFF